MEFIEMTGKQLYSLLHADELTAGQYEASGVADESIVRINRHGDLEIRRANGWEIIGGLLGDFADRAQRTTGLDWAPPVD